LGVLRRLASIAVRYTVMVAQRYYPLAAIDPELVEAVKSIAADPAADSI